MPAASPATMPSLVRVLGPWTATAIVVGTVIGTGVFIVPAEIARSAGSLSIVLLAWVAGGALSLFGALTYAELGAAIPEAGGEYAFIGRAFGERWAYLFGWTHSLLARPCSNATLAAGLMRFVSFLAPAIAVPLATWHLRLPFQQAPYDFVFAPAQLLAAGTIVAVTFVNCLGVRVGGAIQVLLTALKVAAIVVVIALGFALGGHGANPGAAAATAAPLAPVAGFFTALVAVLWAYDGWNSLALAGSEVIEPQKNVPRAMIGGFAVIAALYLLTNAVCFYVLPFAAVAASEVPVADVVRVVGGAGASAWLTLAMMVSALGSLNSDILTGARVPYAMARDGVYFRVAAGISERFRTPIGALVLQGAFGALLALSGTFEDLYSLFLFAQWIFYGLATASVFVLRRKEPGLTRPYRTWGYPVVPALFVLGSIALTLNIWLSRPVRSSLGVLLILAGLPFYRRWRSAAAGAR